MADRSSIRVALDGAFAVALVIGSVTLARGGPPEVPATVCHVDVGAPRYDAMAADGELRVVAMFGQISSAPDFGVWSRLHFEAALVERGFARDGDRFTRGDITLDVIGPESLPIAAPAVTSLALTRAMADYDLVYYNGHEFDGTLALAAPATGYRVVVLDSCWSTQRYSERLLADSVEVISNTERSVTGSVDSFLAMLDGLDARAGWPELLSPMNETAVDRARTRTFSRFRQPEHYRRDVACETGPWLAP